MHDRVATTRDQRDWAVPGLFDAAPSSLDVAAAILGGLASSRLDNALVRDEETAVVSAQRLQPFHRIGFFEILAT